MATVLLGALLAACGTRLPDEAFEQQGRVETVTEVAGATTTTAPAAIGGASTTTTSAPTDPGSTVTTARTGATTSTTVRAGGGAADAPNQASDAGVTETTIRIGNITAENGVLGDTFAPAVRGLRAWVQYTNAHGGIHGRQIELFTCDDREDRARTLECARRLVEQDDVFALVATNTRAFGGAAQYLSDQHVPVIGFPITNSFYRYPEFFTIYGTAYERDGETVGYEGNIVSLSGQYRWFAENMGLTKAAVFNYDIAESSQAGDTFVNGLEAEGFDVARYTISFAAPSFDQAVADMQRRGTELIFDAMDDGANRRLCDAMRRREWTPKAKVSTVVVMGDGVGANYDEACRNVLFVPTESRPYSSDEPGIVQFRNAYAQYQPGLPLHQWAMEAWAMGNITQDALEAMGATPTRQGYIDYLNTMEPNTGGGIMVGTVFKPGSVDYTQPTQRDCLAITRWDDASGGWIEASASFPLCYPDAKAFAAPAAEQGN